MFDIQNEVLEWGGKKLTIETGRVARQAHGSVIATYGGTSVLATVVADREESAVSINLENINLSLDIKQKIIDNFHEVVDLLQLIKLDMILSKNGM